MTTIAPAYIKSNNSVTVYFDGKPNTITSDQKVFPAVLEAIKNKNWQKLKDTINIANAITKYSQGKVTVKDGVVFYNGQPIHNVLTSKIIRMLGEGFDVNPMLKFMDNLMLNPSMTSREELYLFLEKGDMPITEDGHFLAYKKVRDDYMDCHSGRIRNKIGDKPAMQRRDVDDNRNATCSRGLHFCSFDYLRSFGGSRVMILKINPADVVSIPSDYNNTKGRTWTYEVIGELTDFSEPTLEGITVTSSNGGTYEQGYDDGYNDACDYFEENNDWDNPVEDHDTTSGDGRWFDGRNWRDREGRFVSK